MLNKPWFWTVIIIIIFILLIRLMNKPQTDIITGKIKCGKNPDGTDNLVSFGHWFIYGCGKNWYPGRTTIPTMQQTIIIPAIVTPNPGTNPQVTCNPDKKGYDTSNHINAKCGKAPCSDRKGYDIYGNVNASCGSVQMVR